MSERAKLVSMPIDWAKFADDLYEQPYTVREIASMHGLSSATVGRAMTGKPIGTYTFLVLTKYLLDIDPRLYLK